MKSMGMEQGSVVFIHSSMTEFYNYIGTAKELIDKIIEEIGEHGTLLIPAYPKVFENFDDEVDLIQDVTHGNHIIQYALYAEELNYHEWSKEKLQYFAYTIKLKIWNSKNS